MPKITNNVDNAVLPIKPNDMIGIREKSDVPKGADFVNNLIEAGKILAEDSKNLARERADAEERARKERAEAEAQIIEQMNNNPHAAHILAAIHKQAADNKDEPKRADNAEAVRAALAYNMNSRSVGT